MNLKQIKAMFTPGQVWHCHREAAPVVVHGNLGPSVIPNQNPATVRTVKQVRSSDLVWDWLVPGAEPGAKYDPIYTTWPKAGEVLEARPGFLKFKYTEGGATCTFTHQP